MKNFLLILFVAALAPAGFGQLDTITVYCSNIPDVVYVDPYNDLLYPTSYDSTELTKEELLIWTKMGKSEGGFYKPDSLMDAKVCDSIITNSRNKKYYLKVYDTNNILRLEGDYIGYKPYGKTISYYINGSICWIKYYESVAIRDKEITQNTGVWLFYTKKGKLKKTIEWENGRLIK